MFRAWCCFCGIFIKSLDLGGIMDKQLSNLEKETLNRLVGRTNGLVESTWELI
jgi:hypothetical protein